MASVSLRDVAARANVSFQTVSKVLNGKGAVTPATRQRIIEAAEEIGYIPNALARSLQSRSSLTLGVITVDFSNSTPALSLVGIEREARQHGLSVILSSLEPDGSDCVRYLRVLMERRVDGIIMNAPATEEDEEVGRLLRTGPPAVSLHDIAGGGVPTVTVESEGSAALPVRHLLALGHRRIATVTGLQQRHSAQQRTAVYREVLTELGLYDPLLVEDGAWEVEGGYAATHRLLDRAPDITAIYVQNDLMAVGVLNALHERGRSVPDDCSVVGCDDHPVAARTIPPLTTVRMPFFDAGAAAVRLLLDRIASRSASAEDVLPVSMVYRASTASPPAG
ncbi:LacI family DNA-binding transcriptional regulator [Nonomuraea sp. K274]|uniref:LacI family DNA-binding transcriptional regulator n=1 Tax=Nonomuraea cypriaca TaxID=1187855 RepID=A0A931EVJ9_9ACTN|nr:LacI family DNA-binding transcriptional regulator [Nonomuraea cypriaca]MBF8184250.1 LacI family DNA-binding transcriptional regulator [Nonomuraea cypriaca]